MFVAESAPIWRRLAALFYDLLVLVAIWMFAAALVLLAFGGEVDVAHQPPLYHATLQGALLFLTALYFAISWSRGGQTIGMRAWRVKVVDANGHALDFRHAIRRFALALVSFWGLFDADRRAWHDVLAKTRMVCVKAGLGIGD